jgi:Glycosyltransferase sugar-binding region containing DXD motif
MIPKILHYVWLGGAPIPEPYQQYIDGWKKRMPDWEIKRWDETNFDIHQAAFPREAYQKRRWAFVSDYVRIKVLYENGGIYLDTDEEMIRSLEMFADNRVFFGFEAGKLIGGQVFGCEKGNETMKALVDYYEKLSFIDPKGKEKRIVIGDHIAGVLKQLYPSFRFTDKTQYLPNGTVVYASEYFCPDMHKPLNNPNTYTIHHYAGTWLSRGQRIKLAFNDFIGQKNAKHLSHIKQWIKRKINR